VSKTSELGKVLASLDAQIARLQETKELILQHRADAPDPTPSRAPRGRPRKAAKAEPTL
jgi:hypothetical protein